uniref:Amino acid adenylation domain-containing protein n=1 Tax=Candidatus Kentrum sp. LFY TaxID=2126342 RepID=A0A450WCU5_9GAMM|nr:MAG: amino acid adenylation domain-containing protein [Candidatus Kentron sp. LFY]
MNDPEMEKFSTEEKRAFLKRLLRDKQDKLRTSHPLSHGQRALWFLHRNVPDSPAYNTAGVARIRSRIDVPALRAVFQTLLARHPCLRSTFSQKDDQLIQIVHGHQEIHFEEIDASGDTEEALHGRVTEVYRRPFDLEQGPVLRVTLFTRTREDHVLLMTIHHIVTDAWSIWMLLSELLTLYPARNAERAEALPPSKWQYRDFVRWQADLVKSPRGERQWKYWQGQLSGPLPVLDLPTDHLRPPVQSYRGASVFFALPATLTRKLKEQAQSSGITLYTIVLAAFQVLLHRYTGQEDILVGSPVAGRPLSEFEGIFGYFVNPIALRARFSGNPKFSAFLARMRQTVLKGLNHQDYPFPLLVERLQPTRDASRSPIFQVLFALQRAHQDDAMITFSGVGDENLRTDRSGISLSPFRMAQQEGQFDLTLEMIEENRSLPGFFSYNPDLFEVGTIERMAMHLQRLLEGIVAKPETRVSRLPLLTEAERQRIVVEWNATTVPHRRDKCLHQLFEEQIARTPDAVAVVFPSLGSGQGEDEEISYGELNARANRLAHRLRALGVGPEVLVGLFVERSVEMIVGLLAILKAGGAYVPLDPEYPTERLAFLIDDAGIEVLLCHGATRKRLPECTARILDMDAHALEIAGESSENPARFVRSDNLAYVIYTSGSTGTPKGVMIEHGTIATHLLDVITIYNLNENDRVLQFASVSFDASVEQIFSTLAIGAMLIARGVEPWTPRQCLHDISYHGITVANIPPAYMHQLIEIESREKPNGSRPRLVISGGEALPPATVHLWRSSGFRNGKLLNAYGPTETTVTATVSDMSEGRLSDINENIKNVSIGKPLSGRTVYILDGHGNSVPIGIPGELHIGGAGLARGYLNRPELTAEKFIPDPFSDHPDARLYRTGDSCRWLPDGTIEFLGRLDHQVKVRGFRIECGEVENTLLSHPGIREAVVDACGEGTDKQLVAWVVAETDDQPSRDELRTHLRASLPDWMVPSLFVFVQDLPLTPSGKIHRKALPDPDTGPDMEAEYIPPRDSVEDALCRVFAEVLGVERIAIHSGFFELGGHSMLAIRAISLIRQRLGMELPLRALFRYPTPAGLATMIRAREEWQPTILLPLETAGSRPPLFCIHPVGGGAFCYRELADCLDVDGPIYGIQAVGFEGKENPLTDIDTMAARYVEEITTSWPQGPCHLYGWSLGGLVAFEMARQLQAVGREVGLLVLTDTAHPSLFEKRSDPEEDDILLHLLAEAGEVEAALFDELEDVAPANRSPLLRQRFMSASNLAGFGDIDHFVRIYRANLQALATYRPSPWEGNMIFLSARERIGVDGEALHLGWQRLVHHMEHHAVPGNHFTLHRQPNVRGIAEILKGILAETNDDAD